jgi:hypothetical protein
MHGRVLSQTRAAGEVVEADCVERELPAIRGDHTHAAPALDPTDLSHGRSEILQ